MYYSYRGFPGGSDGKASACSVGDMGSIPGSGRSPGEGNGNPFQHFFLLIHYQKLKKKNNNTISLDDLHETSSDLI